MSAGDRTRGGERNWALSQGFVAYGVSSPFSPFKNCSNTPQMLHNISMYFTTGVEARRSPEARRNDIDLRRRPPFLVISKRVSQKAGVVCRRRQVSEKTRDSVREVPRVVFLSAQRDGRDFDRALQPSTSRRYLRYTYLAVQRVLAREISGEVRLLSEYIGT